MGSRVFWSPSLFLAYDNTPNLPRPINKDVIEDRAVDPKKIACIGASMVEGIVDAMLLVRYTAKSETSHKLTNTIRKA